MIKIKIETKHSDLKDGDIVILISNGKRTCPIQLNAEDIESWTKKQCIDYTAELINTGIKLLEENTLKGKITWYYEFCKFYIKEKLCQ